MMMLSNMKWKLAATLFASVLFFSCETEEKKKVLIYEGPLSEMENVDMLYTEKDHLKVHMQAQRISKFQNGDQEFPKGIYLEMYDELGNLSSTLRANKAYFFKEENKWRGQGNVEVKNIAKEQQLNTEELFWNPATKKIFTDKFVTIRDKKDVIYGTGLDADQNLTNYTITNPEGEIDVNEEN
jgi:LPS export ABC transporter protein LptC